MRNIFTFHLLLLSVIVNAQVSSAKDLDISKMQAVLVVGHQEDGTAEAMQTMDEIADVFLMKGITVHKFYDDKADWEKIKGAAKDASFFIYSGHGTRLGGDGKVGGLVISSRISAKQMIDELKLPSNAMVLFKSVCFGAGSSASDDGDIGIEEAVVRVNDYSNTFFKMGASAYYASNLGNGCEDFLHAFFAGKSIEQCFIETSDEWAEVETIRTCKYDNMKKTGIASTDWGGMVTRTTYVNGEKKVEHVPASKDYSIAFVGNSDFTIFQMLK